MSPERSRLPITTVMGGAAALLLLAGLILTPGCRRNVVGSQLMRPEGEPRAVDRILHAQIVTGAGEDRMLYAHHFDGSALNSLGQAKIRLMLDDVRFLARPEMYVVSGQDEHLSAVRSFIAEEGLAFADIRLHRGMNPNTGRPATRAIEAYQKFEEAQLTEGAIEGG